MSNLYFYAVADDLRALIEYVFGATDCRVYEAYSNYDAELREFGSLADIESAFALGDDPNGTSAATLLALWSPRTRGTLDVERIALEVPGHNYRGTIAGWGMLQLQLGGVHGRELTKSRFCHNSEARARLGVHVRVAAWTSRCMGLGRDYTGLTRVAVSHSQPPSERNIQGATCAAGGSGRGRPVRGDA